MTIDEAKKRQPVWWTGPDRLEHMSTVERVLFYADPDNNSYKKAS